MIESHQDTPINLSRRKFMQALLGFSVVSTLAGIVVPIIAYLLPTQSTTGYGGPTDVGKIEDFPVGKGNVVSVSDKPVIVVNTQAGGIKAYSAICTHLGCIVTWDEGRKLIHCPCHDGIFNPVTGAVVSGPPPLPLSGYESVVRDGKLLIGKPLGQLYGS